MIDAGLLDLPEAAEPEAMGAAEYDAFIGSVPGFMKQRFVPVTAPPVGIADVDVCRRKLQAENRHRSRVNVLDVQAFHADAGHSESRASPTVRDYSTSVW